MPCIVRAAHALSIELECVALQSSVTHRRLGMALGHFRAAPNILPAAEDIPGHHHLAAIIVEGGAQIGIRIVVVSCAAFE